MHLCFTTIYHSEIEILVKLTMLKHRPFPSHTFPIGKLVCDRENGPYIISIPFTEK